MAAVASTTQPALKRKVHLSAAATQAGFCRIAKTATASTWTNVRSLRPAATMLAMRTPCVITWPDLLNANAKQVTTTPAATASTWTNARLLRPAATMLAMQTPCVVTWRDRTDARAILGLKVMGMPTGLGVGNRQR